MANQSLLPIVFLAVIVPSLRAQGHPVLLVDINPTVTATVNLGSEPFMHTGALSTFPDALITAWTETTGRELWHTLGTAATTQIVADWNAGVASSNPDNITFLANGDVVLSMLHPTEGYELHRWNQANGLALIGPGDGPLGASAFDLIVDPGSPNLVIGLRIDEVGSHEERATLFTTDGQTITTIKEWGNVARGDYRSFVERYGDQAGQPVHFGGFVFFPVNDGVHGRELWKSDLTPTGTTLVLDAVPGPDPSDPHDLTVAGTRMYMGGKWPGLGHEMLAHDGTSLQLAVDINPNGDSDPADLTESQGWLFFAADDGSTGREPWAFDLTEQVIQIADLALGGPSSNPHNLRKIGSELWFTADNGNSGTELWKVTPGGAPVQAMDFEPGAGNSDPSGVVAGAGALFVAATVGADRQLWESVNSGSSWQQVTTDLTNQGGANPRSLMWYGNGNKLIFRGFDDVLGDEVFIYNPTTGMHEVLDINGPAQTTAGSGAGSSGFAYMNGKTYFGASDGQNGFELWGSDGTAQGTQQVADLNPGNTTSQLEGITELSSTEIVMAANGVGVTGKELYKFDTEALTFTLVKDIRPGFGSSNPGEIFGPVPLSTALTPRVYFRADDGVNGVEPWRTDGSGPGTLLMGDINPGPGGSFPRDFAAAGGVLFFSANDGVHGEELWRSGGSAPEFVMDIYPGPTRGAYLQHTAELDYKLYFSGHAPGQTGLWRTDGSVTELVVGLQPNSIQGRPTDIVRFAGEIYFSMTDGLSGRELWKNDGTIGTAVQLADLNPGSASSDPRRLTVAAAQLFFLATEANVTYLYSYDGTTLTQLDIGLQSSVSGPSELEVHGYQIYFEGGSPTSPGGPELWVSDGTPAGTHPAAEIRRGPLGAQIRDISVTGGRIWVSANNGVNGVEAFLVHGTDPATETFAAPCGPDLPTLSSTTPTIGENVDFSGTAPAGYLGGLVIGTPPTGARLNVLGCEAQVDPAFYIVPYVFVTAAGGDWSYSFPLPDTGYLANLSLSAWAVFLPTNSVDPTQASNGVLLRPGR